MPQTLIAFTGADGMSVKIVCCGELFPNEEVDFLTISRMSATSTRTCMNGHDSPTTDSWG